jgi:serine/threonine-protein kinase
MGTVLLARDRQLGRLVALKCLRDPGPWFLERFRREARVLARLAHPSIVAVHEFDLYAGRAYLAMDYIDGGSLARARLEPRALVRALRGIADALEHAHALGIVHRDVKPENVLLDRRGRAYLADFGVAVEARARHAAAPVGGTPLTMSPEQARGERVGPASDQFSLGVTLYRQLAGAWPFRGRTLADVLFAIQHEDPPPLRALAPGVPVALERVVARTLAKDPARRFASLAELRDELDRFLARRSFLARLFPALAARERRAPSPRPRIHPEELP